MSLTLGGCGDAELAASGSMRQSATDVAASSDAGHAQRRGHRRAATPSSSGRRWRMRSLELITPRLLVPLTPRRTVRGVACGSNDGHVPVVHDRAWLPSAASGRSEERQLGDDRQGGVRDASDKCSLYMNLAALTHFADIQHRLYPGHRVLPGRHTGSSITR